MHFIDLPLDIFVLIFRFLDLKDINQLQLSCKPLDKVTREARVTAVWKLLKTAWKEALNGERVSWDSIRTFMEADRRFLQGVPQTELIARWQACELPRLCTNGNKNVIIVHQSGIHLPNGHVAFDKRLKVDVTNAVVDDQDTIWMSMDNGMIRKWNGSLQDLLAHDSSCQGLTCLDNQLVTCTRTGTVKLWHKEPWSLLATWNSQAQRTWAIGSVGDYICVGNRALGLKVFSPSFDVLIRSESKLEYYGSSCFHKGGVMAFLSMENSFLTAGYDGCWSMFDLRMSLEKPTVCVYDVNDYPLFSLSKQSWKLAVGTGVYSTLRLHDFRSPQKPLGTIFTSDKQSPIYCLNWERGNLWAAGDRDVVKLTFL